MFRKYRTYFFAAILSGIFNYSSAQPLNYPVIFGDDWQKAEKFLSVNRGWMKPAAERLGISYEVAEAVVFPELVRYSALRDKIEITLLKALYINLGEEYADFSIGRFQIKPTFAEKVRISAEEIAGKKIRSLFTGKYERGNIRSLRSMIVEELENPVTEWNYFLAFYAICERKFNLKAMDTDTLIIFLATAYNYGFYHTSEEIGMMTGRKFYSTKLISSNNYSYSDIAIFRYRQIVNKD